MGEEVGVFVFGTMSRGGGWGWSWRPVVFGDAEGGFEDVGLDDLELDCGAYGAGASAAVMVGGEDGSVQLLHGDREFATDGGPFGGFEVVVLEEEDERVGLEERDVGAQELRSPQLGSSVRWRLDGRVSRAGIDGSGYLGGQRCGSRCEGGGSCGMLTFR